jgi:hypothetical protein
MPGAQLPVTTTAGTQSMGAPDTCLVPTGVGPDVPTPFPNTASGATASGTSTKVLVQKHPVLVMGSQTSSTQGDEVGVHGGVASGTTAGPAHHVQGSARVIVEGRGAVLVSHSTGHNGAAANCTGSVVSTSNSVVLASP